MKTTPHPSFYTHTLSLSLPSLIEFVLKYRSAALSGYFLFCSEMVPTQQILLSEINKI